MLSEENTGNNERQGLTHNWTMQKSICVSTGFINVQILQIPLLLRLLKGFISSFGGLAFGICLFFFF